MLCDIIYPLWGHSMNRRHLITTVIPSTIFAFSLTALPLFAEELWKTLPFPTSYPEPDSSGYTEINGARIFHAEWGDGTPVILLHGGLGSIEAWANQIPALAANHKVIAIDSRGHGRSTRDAQPYSYALMATDVLGVMDEMGVEQAAFAGWSDGGIISLELAINHPARINKAIVIGTNYNLSGIDPTVETNETFGAYVGSAAALYAQNSPTPDGFDAFVGDIVGMWGSQPNYTEDQLKSIKASFTVLQAIEDEAIIDEHAQKMASLIPDANYVPLEGVSHFALWQDPERLNGLIVDFLK